MSDRFERPPQYQSSASHRATKTGRRCATSALVLACAVIGVGIHPFDHTPAHAQSEPVRVGATIPPPAKTKDVQPVYPAEAMRSHVEGRVVIEAEINGNGKVDDAKVLQSVPLLDRAALEAVRQWEFTPTLNNGIAVPVIMTITVNFTIPSPSLIEDQVIALLGPPSLQQRNPSGSVTWYYDGTSAGTVRIDFRDGNVVSVTPNGMLEELHRRAAGTKPANPLPSGPAIAMFDAIKSRDVQEVKRLLAGGADANSRDDQGVTSLMWAAVSGSKEIAELLIEQRADVSAKDPSGFTPLHTAAYQSRRDIAELLIANGADVNVKSTAGWTPLHKAMERLSNQELTPHQPSLSDVAAMVSVVELLLAKGADVNATTTSGDTPLLLAASSGENTLIDRLLKKGAAINAKGNEGVTPLYAAVKRDRARSAELLIAGGADVEVKTKSGYTPLILAAFSGNRELVELLLGHGADVATRNDFGMTALNLALQSARMATLFKQGRFIGPLADRNAVERGDYARELQGMKGEWSDVALLLIEHGVDFNGQPLCDDSPLYIAAFVGDMRVAAALIAHGANLNPSGCHESPLHSAIAEKQTDVAELLIDKGANVNARNASERTPLHFLATFIDDAKLAALMIARGADVNARDKNGATPLSYATQAGNKQVAEVLRHRDGK